MNNEIIHIVKALFGSTKVGFKTVVVFLLFSIVTAWLPDGLIAVVGGKVDSNAIIQVAVPIMILAGLWFMLRRIADKSELNVKIDHKPIPAKALILFLSSNKNAQEYMQISSLSDIKSNWKQPLLAIDYHKDYLKSVYILSSKESIEQKDSFEKTVGKLISSAQNIEMIFASAVDFEDAKAIFDALKASYDELKVSGYRKNEIYIDLTGGTKVATIASAIFALPEDRVVQYVTNDGKVKLYDLEYKTEG